MDKSDNQDVICCKIFDVVSKIDTCPNCFYNEPDDKGNCKNTSEEWRF